MPRPKKVDANSNAPAKINNSQKKTTSSTLKQPTANEMREWYEKNKSTSTIKVGGSYKNLTVNLFNDSNEDITTEYADATFTSQKLPILVNIFLCIIWIYKIILSILHYMKNKVGEYRYKQNISISELSKRCGLSSTAISNLENGYTSDILLSHAVALSLALHVDLYELFCIKR